MAKPTSDLLPEHAAQRIAELRAMIAQDAVLDKRVRGPFEGAVYFAPDAEESYQGPLADAAIAAVLDQEAATGKKLAEDAAKDTMFTAASHLRPKHFAFTSTLEGGEFPNRDKFNQYKVRQGGFGGHEL